jgi:response regulator RpfG family c-di-GMP phosphodiesterase
VSPPKVLCVDDDQPVLDALQVTLRRKFRVTTALSGAEGLAKLRKEGPFAVVLTDLRMPAMDGIGFLTRVRDASPDTVRVVLAGNPDLNVAAHAVNEGQIFRLLTKPCPPKQLLSAIEEAAKHYQEAAAKRLLLEETLRSFIKTLTHVLALTNPVAFDHASRVKHLAGQLAEKLGTANAWEIEGAALLSQIGCMTLSRETTKKLYRKEPLSKTEQAMVSKLPEATEELIGEFPGLQGIREILALRDQYFDGRSIQPGSLIGEAIPLAARVLKIALDYEALEAREVPEDRRLPTLHAREGAYDPKGLDALAELLGPTAPKTRTEDLRLSALRPGMFLVNDVVTAQGRLLIARENEVTAEMLRRFGNFPAGHVKQPIRVVVPEAAADTESA